MPLKGEVLHILASPGSGGCRDSPSHCISYVIYVYIYISCVCLYSTHYAAPPIDTVIPFVEVFFQYTSNITTKLLLHLFIGYV